MWVVSQIDLRTCIGTVSWNLSEFECVQVAVWLHVQVFDLCVSGCLNKAMEKDQAKFLSTPLVKEYQNFLSANLHILSRSVYSYTANIHIIFAMTVGQRVRWARLYVILLQKPGYIDTIFKK
jgi:hypothetical protein